MTVDTMRAIDRWLGIPLTFLLTLLHRFWSMFNQTTIPPCRNILFIELSEMGSTILANPAMEKVRKRPDTQLFFAIFAKNKASLLLLNTVQEERIFTLREENIWTLLIDTVRFLLWTRRQHIDTVIDLELFSRFTALLTGLSGARTRVGFHPFHNEGLYRGKLLSHQVAYNPHIHIAKNYLALVYALDAKEQEVPFSKIHIPDHELRLPKILITQKQREQIQAVIHAYYQEYDPARHKTVLINPNASELLPQRRWMPERYQELAQKILETDEDVIILVTGAPTEREEAEELCRQVGCKRCINFAGAIPLIQLPVLYAMAVLMVTNDSGPGHFSAITELPTFVLFGPETPALYGSLGNATSIYAGLACSPCVNAANHRKTPCTDNKCLQAITVAEVFRHIQGHLVQK